MTPCIILCVKMRPNKEIVRYDSAWVNYDTAVDYLTKELKSTLIDDKSHLWKSKNGELLKVIEIELMNEEDIEVVDD